MAAISRKVKDMDFAWAYRFRNRLSVRVASSLLIAAGLGLLAFPAAAHRDLILPVAQDGELERLPETYRPAYIRISPGDHEPVPRVTIVLSGYQVDLPVCIARVLAIPATETMAVAGSWYHETSILPPYVSIELPQNSAESGLFDGFSLLFNLETADLLEIWQIGLITDFRSIRQEPVELSLICSQEEIEQLRPRPAE